MFGVMCAIMALVMLIISNTLCYFAKKGEKNANDTNLDVK